jgi:hypothetical protein
VTGGKSIIIFSIDFILDYRDLFLFECQMRIIYRKKQTRCFNLERGKQELMGFLWDWNWA